MRDKRISTVGFNLKIERLRKKLSQEQLAELSGVSANSLTNIESGKQVPSCLVLYDIAKALNVSITEFFKGI